jgi:transcriptional regulator with XRE-family HTH domain
MIFGNKIRELRENKGLVLRQLAAVLEIDTATISKIERGDRMAKKEQIRLLAKLLEADYEQLHTLWLADKVYNIVAGEKDAIEALKVAEEEVKYKKPDKGV